MRRRRIVLLILGVMTGALARGIDMKDIDRIKADLSRRLAVSEPGTENFVVGEAVTIEPLPAPFLVDGGIFGVTDHATMMVSTGFIGWAGADFAVTLSGNRSAFQTLVARAGVNIGNAELAAAFVQTLLDTTAKLDFRHQVLKSSQEIPVRPGCTEEEARRIAEVKQRYQAIIKPLAVVLEDGVVRARVFALVVQDLVRFDVDVQRDGRFAISETVLEADLAMPYIM